jgi:hypothetical protein
LAPIGQMSEAAWRTIKVACNMRHTCIASHRPEWIDGIHFFVLYYAGAATGLHCFGRIEYDSQTWFVVLKLVMCCLAQAQHH